MVVVAACAAAALAQANANSPSKRDNDVVKDFENRVSAYMNMRRAKVGTSPKPTSSSEKLAETRQQMTARIRQTRAAAKQGDIFTEPIANYFRRQVKATLSGPQGPQVLASLRHAEPTTKITLKVNAKYPQGIPLQSTPPSLLLSLPKLPKELQYRIVGSDLILYDTEADVIVDYMTDVFPAR